MQEGSRYVGVLAAYRDLPEASWRFVIDIDEQERNAANLRLDERGIRNLDDEQEQSR